MANRKQASAEQSEKDRRVVCSLLAWYRKEKRVFPWRTMTLQPWRLLVVEVLLQQTKATRVAEVVPLLFGLYPTLETIANGDNESLVSMLTPLGLQHERSKRLQDLARVLLLRGGTIPDTKEELETLPGVGPYIAASYLSVVLGKPEPAVDVNMARLIERLYGPRTLVDIRYDPHINGTSRRLVELAPSSRDFNWAIMDFGASRCTARSPSCEECPLLSYCCFGSARLAGGTS